MSLGTAEPLNEGADAVGVQAIGCYCSRNGIGWNEHVVEVLAKELSRRVLIEEGEGNEQRAGCEVRRNGEDGGEEQPDCDHEVDEEAGCCGLRKGRLSVAQQPEEHPNQEGGQQADADFQPRHRILGYGSAPIGHLRILQGERPTA